MIPAAEALCLPSARLTCEERAAVESLEAQIDTFVREKMTRNGVQYDVQETRSAVITELQHRIRRAGWQLQTWALEEHSRVSGAKRTVGYRLILTPTDEAFSAAEIRASA